MPAVVLGVCTCTTTKVHNSLSLVPRPTASRHALCSTPRLGKRARFQTSRFQPKGTPQAGFEPETRCNVVWVCRCTTQKGAPWRCVIAAPAASTCCAWGWSGRSCLRGTGPAPAVLSARASPPSASLWTMSRTGKLLAMDGKPNSTPSDSGREDRLWERGRGQWKGKKKGG